MTRRSIHNTPLDAVRLRKAASIAAEIVSKFGDDYWPVFERLERELNARTEREVRLSRYLDSTS